jgi:hypothetical protein
VAKIEELFKKHDTDGSAGLDAEQMKKFMQEYVTTTEGYAEKHVSDEEVKCVLCVASHCCAPPKTQQWHPDRDKKHATLNVIGFAGLAVVCSNPLCADT